MAGGVLYYALGGGLGHLTRAATFLHQMGLANDARILTASSFAADPRVTQQIPTITVPGWLEQSRTAFQRWIEQRICEQEPELICVDCFPAGILGELCDLSAMNKFRLWHLARLLRWREYQHVMRGSPPRYERVWRLESLDAAHQTFLNDHAGEVSDLVLMSLPSPGTTTSTPAQEFWLVLHSGPCSEVIELLAYATDMRAAEGLSNLIVVCSPNAPADLPENCRRVDEYPAHALIASAQRVVTAAGFNVIRDTSGVRDRHYVLPFPRRFDDQFERARQVRRSLERVGGRAFPS